MLSLLEVRNIRTMLPQLITFYKQWSQAVVVAEEESRATCKLSSLYSPLSREMEAMLERLESGTTIPGPRTGAEKEAALRMAQALRACWYLAEQELGARGLGKSEVIRNVDADLAKAGEAPRAPQWQIDSMRKTVRWMIRWYGLLGERQTDPQKVYAAVTIRLTLERALELAELEIRRQALAELAIT